MFFGHRWMTTLALWVMISAPPAIAGTPPGDWSKPFTSPQGVIAGYKAKIRQLKPSDPRGIFLRVYLEISEEMILMSGNHEFKNNAWVEKLMVNYANLYRQAFHDNEIASDELPPAWFAADWENKKTPRQVAPVLLLAAINAHVNRDLPYALISSGTDFARKDLQADFTTISKAFFRRMPRLWDILDRYEHCHRPEWDKALVLQLINYVMSTRRDDAWEKARQLSVIQDPEAREQAFLALESFAVDQYWRILNSVVPKLEDRTCRSDD